MELISQIINDLLDDQKSLSSALLKTKVLARRIQNDELLNWVNNELVGYKNFEHLPDYRKEIFNGLKGNFINGPKKYTNVQIPTSGLDTKFEAKLRATEFFDSVTSLESLRLEDSSVLYSPLSAEITALIEENWRSMGNPYLQLFSANKVIPKTSIVEILSNIRSKLLDFMLEFDGKFGDLTEINDLRMKKDEISSIVNNTIINGDGNVLNTGNNSTIKNSITVNKYNKEDLLRELNNVGVSKADAAELVEIIDNESPNPDTKKFGQQVNTWIGKMIAKTIDGSWDVSIGAAGSLLAEIIKGYYGI